MPVVGILGSVSAAPYARFIEAIKQGLREAGYVEGRNVAIEYRWADGQYDRLPQPTTEVVDRGVAVIILVGGGPTTAAAKAATATVPIVFNTGEDPVKTGAALNRPGGNATGVSLLTVALEAKSPPDVEYIGEINDGEKSSFLSGAIALLAPIAWPEPFGLYQIPLIRTGGPIGAILWT